MKYFDYRKFTLNNLINIKKEEKVTIGLALPVYNEEKTLIKTIKIIRKCKNLIDELIIIDSGSSDNSINICKKMGLKIIDDKKASKDLGIPLKRGKGWNLWASLYYLNTDIIIWIDSDIENINIRFITGLLGPMLIDKKIKFVKGYYHRPKGDARVTEIMVRPFINLIFQNVKDFIQPLSGEYGGRREFLEQVSFYSGYSVEMAVLLQADFLLKKKEIAQVYLGKRIHALQDVTSLGRMSIGILHTLFKIAEQAKYLKLNKRLGNGLQNYLSSDGVNFSPIQFKITDEKLPAMVTLKKYGKKLRKK